IQEAEALDWALDLQSISLDDVGNPAPGLFGPVGIKLDTVAQYLSPVGNNLKRHAIADTGVKRRRGLAWEKEKPAYSLGFGQWQWVEPKATFALKSQRGLLSQRNSYVGLDLLLCRSAKDGALNLFAIGEVSSELCCSRVVEQVNNDVDCASNGSR